MLNPIVTLPDATTAGDPIERAILLAEHARLRDGL